MKSICLKTFNESRFLITLEEYFKSGHMLNTKEVNKLERVTIGRAVSLSLRVKIGLSVKNLTYQYKTSQNVQSIISLFDKHEKFIIAESKKFIGIYLHFDAKSQDILKAYFFAVSYLQDRSQIKERYWEIHNKWIDFLNLAQNEGWHTTSHLFFVDEYRVDWKM